tara:strand:- start:2293 stop:2505 length:213 start_codon:yes stop_codon:yes gene_type:complete
MTSFYRKEITLKGKSIKEFLEFEKPYINVEAGKLISAYEHVLDKECLIGGETKSTYVLKKIIEQELTSRN